MREIRYRTIADDLRGQIVAGERAAGSVLPSEAELAGAYDVSRVTVRKALEVLRDEGRVTSRQGFGWSVAGDPLRQSLDVLATIEEQLASQGRNSVRRALSFRFTEPPPAVRAALDVDEVLEVVRVNLADGAPFGLVTVWCPAELAGGLSRDAVETATFGDLLDVELGAATQTIGAALADERDAEHLDVTVGSPLLVCSRRTRTRDGVTVLVSQHRFPAHLTEFVVELTQADASDAAGTPAGLRLVTGDDVA